MSRPRRSSRKPRPQPTHPRKGTRRSHPTWYAFVLRQLPGLVSVLLQRLLDLSGNGPEA